MLFSICVPVMETSPPRMPLVMNEMSKLRLMTKLK